MKNYINKVVFAVFFIFCLFVTNLQSKDGGSTLTVTTIYTSNGITPTSAVAGGTVSSSGGGATVTERGVCYSINTNPTTGFPK